MTDQDKLKAVETFLKWPIDTEEQKQEVLDQIWFVVVEGMLKEDA